jgi:hypothetical protein
MEPHLKMEKKTLRLAPPPMFDKMQSSASKFLDVAH